MLNATRSVDLPRQNNIVIYGAGNIGRTILTALRRQGRTVVGFLDLYKTGTVVDVPIYHPQHPPFPAENMTVVIGIFSYPPTCDTPYIMQLLKQAGYRTIIDFESLVFARAIPDTPSFFWLNDGTYLNDKEEMLKETEALFADSQSQNLFSSQIKHRQGASYAVLPPISPAEDQYFDPTVPLRLSDVTFLDLGAYDGDTVRSLIRHNIRLHNYYGFEPDLKNLAALRQTIKENPGFAQNALVLPLAVFRENQLLQFESDQGLGSQISEKATNTVTIQAIALDQTFQFEPDCNLFIKMDIEGAEKAAIEGMASLIRTHKPQIACSVYHRPQDLFEIPQLLKSLNPDYQFYLRTYGAHCFDTVLYGI